MRFCVAFFSLSLPWRFALVVGCWLWWAMPARAQQPVRVLPPDTTEIAQPDSLRRGFDEERLLNGLKAYTKRKTIAGKAAALLFRFTPPREDKAGLDAQLVDRQFARHNFKIVRNINITSLDAFGYNINDVNRTPRNFLEKAGNSFHIKTARSRVRQVLLFRPGQELDPLDLAESERLLRQTSEILDARVFVNEATTSADSVDIEVVTKDVFSISGGFQLRDVDAAVVDLRDINFLGMGHQFRNSYQYGRSTPQSWSYKGSYLVPFRDFLYGQVRVRDEYRNKEQSLSLNRSFYSVNTRYAYALNIDHYNVDATRYPDTLYRALRFYRQDIWVGRSLHLPSYDLGYDNPGRLVVAARAINTRIIKSPYPEYRTNTLLYGTLGYTVRRYYKDKYLFGFGRTEDIPTGSIYSFTTGYELNAKQNRHYYGIRAAYAGYSPLRGYLYLNAEFSSYLLRPQNNWQQGQLNTELLYFTPLYRTGNFQWRHFFWNRSTLGFNRLAEEAPLVIDGSRGLRGFNSNQTLRGQSRFILNYEANVFTPLSFLGFRVAAVAFADAAWLSGGGQTIPFADKPYMGFGLGLRFRNEYTVLRTFQFFLGYYPRGQASGDGFRIFQSSRSYYGFNDFSIGQPSITTYQ
ncbi:hypothetical protein F1C16_09995 [Hymenobacter sp. NBH84]|uniref:hypothetical protein n=1 Tax=Hymenobacter sp. NBH84 TaxID=2596915 RepID=UPI0016284401|nr:hypothetical protein [Hymenobacter sp. NBH84]QNE39865.1 hypothetical protein F1C16_09995 [Hymenobacter sp. NBH84]